MKKISTSILVIVMCVACLLTFVACQDSKYAGTYEMVSISGQMTMNGQSIELSEDLYDYYRIILNEDGTAKVQSKSSANTTVLEVDGTWEFSDGKIKLKSTTNGITTVEEMDWNNGELTYSARQSAQGITIEMTIVLQKQ